MHNRLVSVFALAALAAVLSSCSDSPTVAPPAVVVNTPPTIESLALASDRAEANRPLQVTAVLKDAESPLGNLTYTWSATPQAGSFVSITSVSANQAINTWLPAKGQKTPDLYNVTLTVTEAYTSAGQPKQNTVSMSTAVHYNDSPAELVFLGKDFLEDKFGHYEVSGSQAVSNFSNTCSGKAEEESQIEANRENFEISSATFTPNVVTFDSANGLVEGPCTFVDTPKQPSDPNYGRNERVSGVCSLTTVYDSRNYRWWLCDSHFTHRRRSTPPLNLRFQKPLRANRPHLLARAGKTSSAF